MYVYTCKLDQKAPQGETNNSYIHAYVYTYVANTVDLEVQDLHKSSSSKNLG